MLKKLLDLNGIQPLSKQQQSEINGSQAQAIHRCCIRVPGNGVADEIDDHDPRRVHCRKPECRDVPCCSRYN